MIKVLGKEQYIAGIYPVLLWSIIVFFSCSFSVPTQVSITMTVFMFTEVKFQTFPGSLSSGNCLGLKALPK